MPDFHYTACTPTGGTQAGSISAASVHDVVRQLSIRNLFPTAIQPKVAEHSVAAPMSQRIGQAQLAGFYSRLADLLRSGVPILRSLQVIEQQTHHAVLRSILSQLCEDVSQGQPIATAMQQHPRAFSIVAVGMVRAGEQGGFLDDALRRIAALVEQQQILRTRVTGALAYPLFLLLVGSALIVGVVVWFVPRFAPVIERLAEIGDLPTATWLLLGISRFMATYWIAGAMVVICLAVWFGRILRSEAGRRRLDRYRLNLAGIGPIARSLAISRFCRMLGTLLANGVPLLDAMNIAREATGSQILNDAIAEAGHQVSSGTSLARPLARSGQFPIDVIEIISIGETANTLDTVLVEAADTMERETWRRIELVTKFVEPMLLLVMAGAIFFIVAALLLPVINSSGIVR